jgi:5,10-methylenetetrahydromethanopterin reductase
LHLLAQSIEPYHGKEFSLAGGDSLRWNISSSKIPVLLGAWGEQTIRKCAHLVSEVKIGGTTNPQIVRRLRKTLDAAAIAAGRTPDAIDLVVGAVCVVDEDRQKALALARHKAALYLPVIAALDDTLDIEPELLERIKAATALYKFDEAATFISDDLLHLLAFAGTTGDITTQASELYEAGATRIEFGTPHGLTEADGLRLLGELVLPSLRR